MEANAFILMTDSLHHGCRKRYQKVLEVTLQQFHVTVQCLTRHVRILVRKGGEDCERETLIIVQKCWLFGEN